MRRVEIETPLEYNRKQSAGSGAVSSKRSREQEAMTPGSIDIQLAPCPNCGGSGWESVEGKGVRPCRCKTDARTEMLLAQARIPKRFQHCDLNNFEPACISVGRARYRRSEEHTSELQSLAYLVCRL